MAQGLNTADKGIKLYCHGTQLYQQARYESD